MARRKRQWYDTKDGKRRLQVEHEAIQRLNSSRRADLQLKGRKHEQGNLMVEFGFQPLTSKPNQVTRAEIVLSSMHPELEPVARIISPQLTGGKHLLCAEMLRSMLHNSIPLDWARKGPALCMWTHGGNSNVWLPTFTVATVVNNIQSYYLNYLFWCATGRWVFDESRPTQRRLLNRLPNEVAQ